MNSYFSFKLSGAIHSGATQTQCKPANEARSLINSSHQTQSPTFAPFLLSLSIFYVRNKTKQKLVLSLRYKAELYSIFSFVARECSEFRGSAHLAIANGLAVQKWLCCWCSWPAYFAQDLANPAKPTTQDWHSYQLLLI